MQVNTLADPPQDLVVSAELTALDLAHSPNLLPAFRDLVRIVEAVVDHIGPRTEFHEWAYGPFDDLEFRSRRRRRGEPSGLTELADEVLAARTSDDELYVTVSSFLDKVQIEVPTLDPRAYGTIGSRRVTLALQVPAPFGDQVAHAVLDWLRLHSSLNDVVTGFVHVDDEADPYTTRIVERVGLTANEFDWQIHGYYWAVLLTEGHLRRADIDALADIDGAHVDWVHPRRMAMVTAAPNPSDLTSTVMQQWRTALLPLLREGLPVLKFDTVPGSLAHEQWGGELPPNMLRQPRWLLEGPPVPYFRHELFGEDDGRSAVDLTVDDDVLNAARIDVVVELSSEHDVAESVELLDGLLFSWYVVWTSRLARPDHGAIRSMTRPELVTSDDRHTVCWSFEPGTADLQLALPALSFALGALQAEFGGPLFNHISVSAS